MADATTKVTLEDIVAAAGAGAMRAMDSRRVSDERISMDKLIGSGFGVRFQIWCGGIWGPNGPYGPWGPNGTGPGGPGTGGIP
jgi:hypothetical protein